MTPPEPRRLKVLHLAFEDHRRPGSGGGSARNRQVNRRLAQRHDITVLTAGYAGAQDRTEDGVRHEHVGIGRGYWVSLITYFLALPFVVRRRARDHDLVIEEFAAPISSVSVPRWTTTVTLAVVQWMDARGKSRQYKLPFFLLENAGVRSHRRFVAVSEDVGHQLHRRNPTAAVDVVPNGVEAEAFAVEPTTGEDIVFLGRLEIAQKGLDVLLDAYAEIAGAVGGRLLIAGDGPDRAALERRTTQLGLTDRVVFLGRVDGPDRLALLAGARLVAMPSRYESFGMVAIEAQACGSPVVATDIPCLREVVPHASGRLVSPLTPAALGEALRAAYDDEALLAAAPVSGRDFARRYSWDQIALQQEQAYLAAVDAEVAPSPVGAGDTR